jgi:hypothetical protein
VNSKGAPGKRTGYGSSHGPPRIQGYIYNWVKKGLQRRIGQNLKLILSIDLPRTSPAVSTLADASRKKATADFSTPSENTPRLGLRSKERFTLLRGTKALTSANRPDKTEKDANVDHDRLSSKATDLSNGLPTYDFAFSDVKNHRNDSLDLFFDCPILGAMIKRKFANIWWDITYFQAVQGVCDNLLKPQNLVYQNVAFTVVSRNILLSNTVLQEGVMNILLGKESEVIVKSDADSSPQRALTSSWRVVVRGNNAHTAIRVARRLSSIQYLGVFSSFSVGDEMQNLLISTKEPTELLPKSMDQKSAPNKEVLEKNMIETMIDEARNLLPHLLSLKCSSDSVLLNKSIITMEPDRFAETACRIVVQIIEDGGAVLMKRRDECIAIDSLHKHSLFVLDTLNSIIEHIKASVEEIQRFLRIASAHLVVLTNQLASIRPDIQKTSLYEQYQICLNDECSIKMNIQRLDEDIVIAKNTARANLTAVSLRDWNTLGAMFSDPKSSFYSSAPLDLIDSFKGVLLLTETKSKRKGFGINEDISKKNASKKPDSSERKKGGNRFYVLNISDSDALYRGAEQMSSSDVVSKLLLRHGDNISSEQYLELRTLNEAMSKREEARPSSGTPETEFINQLTSRLRNFLFQIEKTCAATISIANWQECLQNRSKEREQLFSAVEQVVKNRTNELLNEKAEIENYISGLDAEVSSNRTKVARLANIDSVKRVLEVAIEAHRTFVDSERKQIDAIMKNLVADSCIAAAVLVRSGWLPEQIRQEAMDEFRRNLKSHIADIKMSDDPFVLGCMLDRAQVNRWTLPTSPKYSLPRDPASINSLSLVLLNPVFSYVVDPEGSAPIALRSAFVSNYEIFETSAINFSIAALCDLIQSTKGSMKPIAMIVTDTQAGVSKDLISFLSSELDCVDIEALPGSTILDTKRKLKPSVHSEAKHSIRVVCCL